MQSLIRRQAVFTLGMLLCGALEVVAALVCYGVKGAEGAVYSVLLCLIPGWLTVYAGDLMKRRGLGAYIVLVGTALRMLFVLMGLLVITTLRHDLGFYEFTVWLIVSYMVGLALETWIILLPPRPGAV